MVWAQRLSNFCGWYFWSSWCSCLHPAEVLLVSVPGVQTQWGKTEKKSYCNKRQNASTSSNFSYNIVGRAKYTLASGAKFRGDFWQETQRGDDFRARARVFRGNKFIRAVPLFWAPFPAICLKFLIIFQTYLNESLCWIIDFSRAYKFAITPVRNVKWKNISFVIQRLFPWEAISPD